MSYDSRAAAPVSDFGSGGKLLRPRRLTSSRTPYHRPDPQPPREKPNWLSTAGRFLATGAGKLISTVIGSDTSSSGSDSGSDDDFDNQDACIDTESQPVISSSESKQKIEELIAQETFSWEESDALIQIVRSRTVDAVMLTDNQDTHKNNLRDAAVVEARKWIEERKKESSSKSLSDYGTCSITKEADSPIDVARTYMRVCPPRASPTANLSDLRSSTPVKIQALTDGSSFPSFSDVLSSQTKQRHYLASGSWSIAEEMRKVRARATDELLSTPSRKIDLSFKREAHSESIQYGHQENLAGSSVFTLAAVADKGDNTASTRSAALDATGEGLQHEPITVFARMDMDQVAAPSSCEGDEVGGGLTLPEDSNDLHVGISTANDFQGVTRKADGASTEPNAECPSPEAVHTNTHNEVPDHNSQATTGNPSEHDGFMGSSQQTSAEEPTIDASKSNPEVLLAVPATKKKYRVKQPVRRVRGRGK